jgi:hypothetical protein
VHQSVEKISEHSVTSRRGGYFHTAFSQKHWGFVQAPQAANKLDEIIERIIKREHNEIAIFELYTPIIETSGRDKMPLEVTPLVPYLTRYVEVSASQSESQSAMTFPP